MKSVVGAVAVLGLGLAACATDEVETTSSEASVAKRWLVVMRTEALTKDATKKIDRAGAKLLRSLPDAGLALISATDAQANKLAADPAFLAVGQQRVTKLEDIEPVLPTPSDFFTPLQWDMRRIGAPALWSRNIPETTVAVLDTGVMSDHYEFASHGTVVDGVTTSFCAGTDGGPTHGYPVFNAIADVTIDACVPIGAPAYFDDAFHGTHVAGTIAAPVNGGGVIGVSPTTKIAAYQVFDIICDNAGCWLGAFDFPIFQAIEDATAKGYKVINMSLGGFLDRSTRDGNAAYVAWSRMTSRAFRKGTLIVAAAGNDSTNNNGTNTFIPSDLPSVMSVSATGTNQWEGEPYFYIDESGFPVFSEFTAAPGSDVLTEYSNYGAAVDIAAPGGDAGPNGPDETLDWVPHLILSPCAFTQDPADMFSPLDPGILCWAAGTSMAAPHVAGVAGAVRALHPTWTPGQVRDHLKTTAIPVPGRQGFGAGIVNADLATR